LKDFGLHATCFVVYDEAAFFSAEDAKNHSHGSIVILHDVNQILVVIHADLAILESYQNVLTRAVSPIDGH